MNRQISNEQIKEWLLELISGEENSYGYRKLTKALRRQHKLKINKKKVYRLCKELKILNPQHRKKVNHPRKLARNRVITGVNQLWETDIKYGYIAGEDRFFFIMCMIDVYDRVIIDYHIGLSCEGRHAANLIERSLWKRKLVKECNRPIIRTDNGPQYVSNIFETTCTNLGVEHERIPPKTPNLNAHIESFHSILESDCLSKHEFISYQEAYKTVCEYIDFYVNRRLHGSLRDIPPIEFHNMVVNYGYSPFVVKV